MAKIFSRIKFGIPDAPGTGTVTVGTRSDNSFLLPVESGAVDGDVVTYCIQKSNKDLELGRGTIASGVTEVTRDTVIFSIINGTAGTSKINIDGSAFLAFVDAAEDFQSLRNVRTVTASTDTLANGDGMGQVTYNRSSAVAVSLAQAGTSLKFLKGWLVFVRNIGAGAVTITPATSTINGASTLVLSQGDSALIVSDGTNYTAIVWAAPVVSTVSGRNRLLNGVFSIDQRNEGAALTLTTSNAYGPDRWLGSRGSNVSTIQRNLTGGPTSPNIPSFIRAQRTAANTGTGAIVVGQVIESKNMTDLAGQDVVISFYARCGANYSPTSNLLNVKVRSGTVADEGNTGLTAGSWTGVATPIDQNATLTTSWQRFSYTATLGASALETGVLFAATPTGTAGAADYFDITGVQLEYGTSPTRFDFRDAGQELQLCQRYCIVASGWPAGFTQGAQYLYSGAIFFPVTMRIAPTYSNASFSAGTPPNGTFAQPVVSPSTANGTTVYNSANNWTTGTGVVVSFTASAEL